MEQAINATKDETQVRRKLSAIKRDCKTFKNWEDDAKKLVRRYRNEKQESLESSPDPDSRFNIFWSNVQTLVPSLYARTPVPQAERRFKDKDEYARVAAEILERGTRFQIDDYDFDSPIAAAVLDLCLIARGLCRVRYTSRFDETGEVKTSEDVKIEYVFWRDFSHSPARQWEDVQEVRFRLYLTKEDALAQFGDIANRLKYRFVSDGLEDDSESADTGDDWKKAEVWEVWDKKTRTVCYLSSDVPDQYLKHEPDTLKLKGFFPCPKPLYGTLTTDSLVPVPDYMQYRHLANSLDTLIKKEQSLVDGLKVAGCYDSLLGDELQQLVNTHSNILIPVKNWPAFQAGGGFDGAIQWWPLSQVVEALQVIQAEKEVIKNDIYEITGWSDIMRGVSDPNETAQAQQMKGRFSSIRLTRRQMDVQRFVKDLVAMTAEIQSELFDPQTFMAMTGLEFVPSPPAPLPGPNGEPPPPITPEQTFQYKQQFYMRALELLRNDAMRRFKIDIETDSTLAIDEALDKANKQEYAGAVSTFVQGLGAIAPQIPTMVPALCEILSVISRGYKAGRSVEAALEEALEETKKQLEAAKNQPPQPDPKMELEKFKADHQMRMEQMKAESSQQLALIKVQQGQEIAAVKAQVDAQRIGLEHERAVRELEFQMFVDKAKAESEIQIQQVQAQADAAIKMLDARIKASGSSSGGVAVPTSGAAGNLQLTLNLPRKKRRVIANGKGPDGKRSYQFEDVEDEEPSSEAVEVIT